MNSTQMRVDQRRQILEQAMHLPHRLGIWWGLNCGWLHWRDTDSRSLRPALQGLTSWSRTGDDQERESLITVQSAVNNHPVGKLIECVTLSRNFAPAGLPEQFLPHATLAKCLLSYFNKLVEGEEFERAEARLAQYCELGREIAANPPAWIATT